MSTPKERHCDCCGTLIKPKQIQSEYDGHVSYVQTYKANNYGNPAFVYNSKNDAIFGLVDLHMYRNQVEHTVVPSEYMAGDRCADICPHCKVKFLEAAIAHIKKHE